MNSTIVATTTFLPPINNMFDPFIFSTETWLTIAIITKISSYSCVPLLCVSLYILVEKKRTKELATIFHSYLAHIQMVTLVFVFFNAFLTDIPSYGFFLPFYQANADVFGRINYAATALCRVHSWLEIVVASDRFSAVVFPFHYAKSILRHTRVWTFSILTFHMLVQITAALIMGYRSNMMTNAYGWLMMAYGVQPIYRVQATVMQYVQLAFNVIAFFGVILVYGMLIVYIGIAQSGLCFREGKHAATAKVSKVARKLAIVGFICSSGEAISSFMSGMSTIVWNLFAVNFVDTRVYWNLVQIGHDTSCICYAIIPLIAFHGIRQRLGTLLRLTSRSRGDHISRTTTMTY